VLFKGQDALGNTSLPFGVAQKMFSAFTINAANLEYKMSYFKSKNAPNSTLARVCISDPVGELTAISQMP